jgi:hypothetical protein
MVRRLTRRKRGDTSPRRLVWDFVLRDGVRLHCRINDLERIMTDISSAYLYAECSAQFIRVRRQGIQNDGGPHVRYSASPLRNKGAGASWNQHLALELRNIYEG